VTHQVQEALLTQAAQRRHQQVIVATALQQVRPLRAAVPARPAHDRHCGPGLLITRKDPAQCRHDLVTQGIAGVARIALDSSSIQASRAAVR
jgi:hypothetical protein